jgi:ABC-type uncharacterized transport system substrate-binding protein
MPVSLSLAAARSGLGGFLLILTALLPLPALSHPHVWASAKAEIIYDPDGKVTGIRHVWTFDEGYSAYATQGLDKDGDGALSPDELVTLAKEYLPSLAEFDYFTSVTMNGDKQGFSAPQTYAVSYGRELTLDFVLPLRTATKSKSVLLEIFDPSLLVYLSLSEDSDAVRVSEAKQDCTIHISRPGSTGENGQPRKPKTFLEALMASSSTGPKIANRVVVSCP